MKFLKIGEHLFLGIEQLVCIKLVFYSACLYMQSKMKSDKMLLTWDDHKVNASSNYRQLWGDQEFADVTLASEDNKQIRAHKVILGSCSPFFRNILINNPHPSPLLYLKGIKHRELEFILEFIYQGQCHVGTEELQDFLKAGSDLRVSGLLPDATKQANNSVKLISLDTALVDKSFESTLQNILEEQIPDKNTAILPQNKFYCDSCIVGFRTEVALAEHKLSKHTAQINCDNCEYKSFSKLRLERHEKIHLQSNANKHARNKGKSMGRSSSLPSPSKFYKCDQCNYSVTTRKCLMNHNKSKHASSLYKCDNCPYKCTSEDLLTIHMVENHFHEGQDETLLLNRSSSSPNAFNWMEVSSELDEE
jgi:hypothetical protein